MKTALLGLAVVCAVTGWAATPDRPAANPAPAASATRSLVLYGPLTNMTAEVTANARLTLAITGEKVAGILKTEPPLTGTGAVEGRFVGGWCELRGKLNEGFRVVFRGAFNGRDYRGTYVAVVPGAPAQYGKFQLRPVSATARPADGK